MKIIGISGKKGAGKDTIANMLVKSERFTKIAFATPLKEMCAKVFDIDLDVLNDEKLKEKELNQFITLDKSSLNKIQQILKEWDFDVDYVMQNEMIDYIGRTYKTPRQLLQGIGTDLLRKVVRDDIWIYLAFQKMREISSNIVVSDVRFKNEREALKKAGANLILVTRDSLTNKDNHSSENDLGTEKDYDVVIKNNDISLNVLGSELLMWYSVKVKYT